MKSTNPLDAWWNHWRSSGTSPCQAAVATYGEHLYYFDEDTLRALDEPLNSKDVSVGRSPSRALLGSQILRAALEHPEADSMTACSYISYVSMHDEMHYPTDSDTPIAIAACCYFSLIQSANYAKLTNSAASLFECNYNRSRWSSCSERVMDFVRAVLHSNSTKSIPHEAWGNLSRFLRGESECIDNDLLYKTIIKISTIRFGPSAAKRFVR